MRFSFSNSTGSVARVGFFTCFLLGALTVGFLGTLIGAAVVAGTAAEMETEGEERVSAGGGTERTAGKGAEEGTGRAGSDEIVVVVEDDKELLDGMYGIARALRDVRT